ncbi:MAG: TIM44-like domain-containing protein [Bosea sp. (in: a-proteobacteria)]
MSLRPFSSGRLVKGSRLVAAVAIAALTLVPVLAEARPGGGKSSGSRGSKTHSAAPSTNTAPNAAQPMQRTAAPAPAAATAAPAAGAAAAAAQAARPSFARTMMMGLGAGLLGAGLFGLLSGSGLFGGLSGLASFFGLILQAALIAGLIYLAVRFFRRRSEPQPAMAGGMPAMSAGPVPTATDAMARQGMQPPQGSSFGGFGGQAPQPVATQPIQLVGEDFGVFEQRLQGIMDGYSRQDVAAISRISTAEMAGYLADDLAEDAQKGVMDVSRDVKLVQGDLAEAWREGSDDYATVAMRFSVINTIKDKATGRILEGHPDIPREVTELWTFVRPRGGEWLLSAIQQAV